jgi:hypothetical protein
MRPTNRGKLNSGHVTLSVPSDSARDELVQRKLFQLRLADSNTKEKKNTRNQKPNKNNQNQTQSYRSVLSEIGNRFAP